MKRSLFAVGIGAALAAAVIAIYVSGHPYNPEEAALESDVQSIPWGPLLVVFPFFSWIGDTKGFVLELIMFIAILIFNRRAWLIAVGMAATGLWYQLLSHAIHRPRPTTAQVLQVTEHPGAWSFPSGHTIFITTVTVMLMLCLGYRFLRGWGRVAGWIVVAAVIAANGIARMYTGTHWPTDVLGGILIAVAWICIWLSPHPIYRRLSETSDSGERRLSPIWARRRAS